MIAKENRWNMSNLEKDPAYKLFIEDLRSFEGSIDAWYFKFSKESDRTRINQFQIQAKICKVTGFNSEIMIVSDETGKAKVTRSTRVPGDFSWIKPDAYCSIFGTLLDTGKLPHINIVKLGEIKNKFLQEMWPVEVVELKKFITRKIVPEVIL